MNNKIGRVMIVIARPTYIIKFNDIICYRNRKYQSLMH